MCTVRGLDGASRVGSPPKLHKLSRRILDASKTETGVVAKEVVALL